MVLNRIMLMILTRPWEELAVFCGLTVAMSSFPLIMLALFNITLYNDQAGSKSGIRENMI